MQLALDFDEDAPPRVTWTIRVWSWMEVVADDWWNSSCARCARWAWDGCTCGFHPGGRCGMRGLCYGQCGLTVEPDDDDDWRW